MFTSHVHHIHIIFLDATWAKIIRYKSVSKKMMYNASPKWKKTSRRKRCLFWGSHQWISANLRSKGFYTWMWKTTLNVDHFHKKRVFHSHLSKNPNQTWRTGMSPLFPVQFDDFLASHVWRHRKVNHGKSILIPFLSHSYPTILTMKTRIKPCKTI